MPIPAALQRQARSVYRTRVAMLDMAAADRLRVAGMHLHFPTLSHVVRRGGGYALLPECWAPSI